MVLVGYKIFDRHLRNDWEYRNVYVRLMDYGRGLGQVMGLCVGDAK